MPCTKITPAAKGPEMNRAAFLLVGRAYWQRSSGSSLPQGLQSLAAATERSSLRSPRAFAAGRPQQTGNRSSCAAASHVDAAPPSPVAAAGPATDVAPHLFSLNREQLQAVTAPLGATRVVAGPGSGKTRVLIARIAHLIHAHGVQPWQVVAITFTNKAADEMRERLGQMLGPEAAKELFAGTFHSLCYRILRRSLTQLPGTGRTNGWQLYDQDAAQAVLIKMVKADTPKGNAAELRRLARKMHSGISRVKNGLITCHSLTGEQAVYAHLHAVRGPQLTGLEEQAADELAGWFDRYQAALQEANALDFDDLLGMTVALLGQCHELRDRLRRRWRHVLVDEFQDTNSPQYELVKLLAGPDVAAAAAAVQEGAISSAPPTPHPATAGSSGKSVFVVGDPDQAIYGFRGANYSNMRFKFAKDFAGGGMHRLQDNYRSTPQIVAGAQAVIARNTDDDRTTLQSRRTSGPAIRVYVVQDAYEEAALVAETVAGLRRRGGCREEDIAVLFRTHKQARLIEQAMVERGVRYVLVGGMPFWRRTEVQDVMAYLRLAVNPGDVVALDRIINVPTRGLGAVSLTKLAAAAANAGGTLPQLLFGCAASAGAEGAADMQLPELPAAKALGLSAKTLAIVEDFRSAVAAMRSALASEPLSRALEQIMKLVQYDQHVLDGKCGGKEGEEEERIERLRQLVHAAGEYTPGALAGAPAVEAALEGDGAGGSSELFAAGGHEGLAIARSFLDEAALYSGVEEGGEVAGGVRLMTMHAAKGLEFEVVFVPGCNEGLVPLFFNDNDYDAEELDEETRLFFVTLTRAKRDLRLLHTRENVAHGYANRQPSQPSRFLEAVVESGHAEVIHAPIPDNFQPSRSDRYSSSSSSSSRRKAGSSVGSATSPGLSGPEGAQAGQGSGSQRMGPAKQRQARRMNRR